MGSLRTIGTAAFIAGIAVFVIAILMMLDFSVYPLGGYVGYFYYFGASPAERSLLVAFMLGILWGPALAVVGLSLRKVRKVRTTISS